MLLIPKYDTLFSTSDFIKKSETLFRSVSGGYYLTVLLSYSFYITEYHIRFDYG